MRGKGSRCAISFAFPRITPAYAGKSQSSIPAAAFLKDHPRLCGEKWFIRSSNALPSGSPPPMRGKAHKAFLTRHRSGITPAYAGKSPNPSLILVVIGDHPRLCGEKFSRVSPSARTSGSPPPMRGKDEDHRTKAVMSGITPAYAGKSQKFNRCPQFVEDHPRLCGEKSACMRASLPWTGSPPPMRGKVAEYFTPEHVTEDHPRLCGEKIYENEIRVMFGGSPPPMRGKGSKRIFSHLPSRITPAYAGKSTRSRIHHQFSRDHPRLCGEKIKPVHPLLPPPGSPPPMRGKATANGFLYWNPRITPAYAGKRQIFMRSVCSSQDHPRLCGEKQPVPRQRIE